MHLSLTKAPGLQTLTQYTMPKWLTAYFEAFKAHAVANNDKLPQDLMIVSVEMRIADRWLHIEMECFKDSDKSRVDIWGENPAPKSHKDFFGLDDDEYQLRIMPGEIPELIITAPFTTMERPHIKVVEGERTEIVIPEGTSVVSLTVTPQHVLRSVDGGSQILHELRITGVPEISVENPSPMPSFDGMEYSVLVD